MPSVGAIPQLGQAVPLSTEKRITYAFDRDAMSAAELIARVTQRLRVVDLALKEPDIETTVRRIYEDRLLDG